MNLFLVQALTILMIKQSYVVNVSNVGLTSDFSVFPEDLRLYAVESRVE